jgi:pantoate--beta-alanine ligase
VGGSRPGHFNGGATIVLKLVTIVTPHLRFMGDKDFQQVVVLQTMLRDLNVSTQIVPCPIVREKDGLAMSSRNVYLNPQEREQALCLSEAIQIIKSLYKKGITNSDELIRRGSEIIERKDGRLDYLKLVDSNSLEDMTVADSHTRIILAVFIGRTRLIDNQAMCTKAQIRVLFLILRHPYHNFFTNISRSALQSKLEYGLAALPGLWKLDNLILCYEE